MCGKSSVQSIHELTKLAHFSPRYRNLMGISFQGQQQALGISGYFFHLIEVDEVRAMRFKDEGIFFQVVFHFFQGKADHVSGGF